ncbi:flagellar motor protein MotB [Pandoraea apista]|uniref:flagellar motor protein MotB n=1 Tax=Pandoraea apista TaxID=93218 RepID=UPI000F65D38D|nr:flagellar motor protein MotB [Pandoraea apista]RRW88793.1 histidine kinase [Pandoraea apista]RRW98052.1 histidine kinase [Pandoraea apista]
MTQHKEVGHTTTIIKRRHRRHEEHSGGAWKVAFADFTLALMALFMVLWIVSVTPDKDRHRVARAVGGSPIFAGGLGIFEQSTARPAVMPPDADRSQRSTMNGPSTPARGSIDSLSSRRALALRILGEVRKLGMTENVGVSINDQGLRISVHDSDGNDMFNRRNDTLNPAFVKLFEALTPVLASVVNKMMVIGHTDAIPFMGPSVFSNNWSLASRRALRVRQLLIDSGIEASRLFQVSGMGDSTPMLPDAPNAGKNRRVELLLMTDEAEETWRRQFQGEEVDPERVENAVSAMGAARKQPAGTDKKK